MYYRTGMYVFISIIEYGTRSLDCRGIIIFYNSQIKIEIIYNLNYSYGTQQY